MIRKSIAEKDIRNVIDVLKGDLLTRGLSVTEFEEALTNKVRSKTCYSGSKWNCRLASNRLSSWMGKGKCRNHFPDYFSG